MNIQWFPGHMAKTRRLISDHMKLVDIVLELVDARLPQSSRNPEIDKITETKPRIILLNKADLADEKQNSAWISYFEKLQLNAVLVSSTSGKGFDKLIKTVPIVLKEKIERQKNRGITGKLIKIMVVGIPNVGKSSLINRLSGRASTKTGDRPGVTTGKQWIAIRGGFELLDTPGVLWPKFEDLAVGLKLAYTGAIKDDVIDLEEVACCLLELLALNYPERIIERYKIDDVQGIGNDILQKISKKRGFLVSGGEVDTLKGAIILLDEFRGGKLGRITLEKPGEIEDVRN